MGSDKPRTLEETIAAANGAIAVADEGILECEAMEDRLASGQAALDAEIRGATEAIDSISNVARRGLEIAKDADAELAKN